MVASLCLYGTDEAIDAYEKYTKDNLDKKKGGDIGELILDLRKSLDQKERSYQDTHITADEAKLAIWNDPKYLKNSPAVK